MLGRVYVTLLGQREHEVVAPLAAHEVSISSGAPKNGDTTTFLIKPSKSTPTYVISPPLVIILPTVIDPTILLSR